MNKVILPKKLYSDGCYTESENLPSRDELCSSAKFAPNLRGRTQFVPTALRLIIAIFL